ncbi:hypothetical protein JW898_04105 [Candidatus Woesearchaeota archaeon]|nr:hypothetical protein [Candidatus Woesearchaeota archaeon]
MAARKRDLEAGRKQTLPTNNLFALIIILLAVSSAFSSYLAYHRSERIAQELTGELVTSEGKARICVNKQPTINQSCNTTAIVGAGYYCDVDATDPDNDTITFYDNTALFNIDPNTGEIIFTPDAGDSGTHSIIITASDGKGCSNSNATASFTITIPSVPGVPGAGGGGGGGAPPKECIPQWECTPWSACRPDGTRTRTCYTLNNCPKDKPSESESCIYVLPPAPREPKFKQFEFCNFDTEEACTRNVGINEDWLLTYRDNVRVMNFLRIDGESIDLSIDDELLFSVGMKRIKPADLDGDGVDDVEFIYHSTSAGRADLTGKRIKQLEVVRERPIYIQMMPWWLTAILIFVYNNSCAILIIVLILAAILIYAGIMRKTEEEKKKKD